jgi:hypothetical protein
MEIELGAKKKRGVGGEKKGKRDSESETNNEERKKEVVYLGEKERRDNGIEGVRVGGGGRESV